MTATARPRNRTNRSLITMYTVSPSHGRDVATKTYTSALKAATRMENDLICDKIEVFKAGAPLQWWTRNFNTGDWDFHGQLVAGGK
jgi:hypothetical protein